MWYASTQTWFDRQADLRTTLQGRADGWAPAVWLKVVGQWTDRDNTATFSLFNKSYSFDVGYRQDTAGLIGGVDFLRAVNGLRADRLFRGGFPAFAERSAAVVDAFALAG